MGEAGQWAGCLPTTPLILVERRWSVSRSWKWKEVGETLQALSSPAPRCRKAGFHSRDRPARLRHLMISSILSDHRKSGLGWRTGGNTMSAEYLPAIRTERPAWNKGRIIGQKRPRLPKHGCRSASAWRWQTSDVTWRCSIWPWTTSFGDATGSA